MKTKKKNYKKYTAIEFATEIKTVFTKAKDNGWKWDSPEWAHWSRKMNSVLRYLILVEEDLVTKARLQFVYLYWSSCNQLLIMSNSKSISNTKRRKELKEQAKMCYRSIHMSHDYLLETASKVKENLKILGSGDIPEDILPILKL